MTRTAEPATERVSSLGHVENVLLGTALVATAVVVLAQITFRFLLREPLSWATEVATDLLVWSAFLGLAVGVRDRAHVALSLLEDRFPVRANRMIRLAQRIVLAFLLGSLCFGGVLLVLGELHTVSSSGVPRWMVFSAVPVGAGLALLHVVAQAALDHAGERHQPGETTPAVDEGSAGHRRPGTGEPADPAERQVSS
jgi:TRAP-type C4-dicarboxylate transport system permease small subunit